MMTRTRSGVALAAAALVLGGALVAGAHGLENRAPAGPVALMQAQQPPDDFVPVTQLPETEQLPAAPLLIAAYIVVWLVLLVYLLSLWRRMAAVDRELADVERRVAGGRRS